MRSRPDAMRLRFKCTQLAVEHADRHEKNAIMFGVESGCLEIELEPSQLFKRKLAKIVPSGCDEVLLVRWQQQEFVRRDVAYGSRRHTETRPLPSAQTETIPGVASPQPFVFVLA